jgi:hypothetical protein
LRPWTLRLILGGGAAALWTVSGSGQTGSAGIGDFRVPRYDENGVLESVLSGKFAKPLPDGTIDISELRVDFYRDGTNVETTVTAPRCIYDQRRRLARSDSSVRVDAGQMKVTGEDFVCDVRNERFQIRKKARVEIPNARRKVSRSEQNSEDREESSE